LIPEQERLSNKKNTDRICKTLDKNHINTSRHFLKTWPPRAMQWTIRRKINSIRINWGQRKRIKWWISERAYSNQLRVKTIHALVNPSSNWEWCCTWRTSSFGFNLWNMAIIPNICYLAVAFEWMSEICIPPRLTMGPSILKPKGALHRMNMGDEHYW
jgi:hypothetical protein